MQSKKIELIQSRIRSLSLAQERRVASFDADGTLWQEDVNDLFLSYQRSESPKIERHFQNFLKHFQGKGLHLHLPVWQEGLLESELRDQARKMLKEFSIHPFEFQKDLMLFLKKEGFQIYVVTASLKILVEETLKSFNFPTVEGVLGIETEIKKGRFTKKLREPITQDEGKREAFFLQTRGVAPGFSSGNTLRDLDLMARAKVRLAIHFSQKGEKTFFSERGLQKIAKEREWFTLSRDSFKR